MLQQIPRAGTQMPPDGRIYLITEERSKLAVPNLRGLSLRDALEVCSLMGLKCVAEGEGFVENQILASAQGERVLKLVLEPPGITALPEADEEDGEGEAADGQDEQDERAEDGGTDEG